MKPLTRRSLIKTVLAASLALTVLPMTIAQAAPKPKYAPRFNRRMKRAIRARNTQRFVSLYVKQNVRYEAYLAQ